MWEALDNVSNLVDTNGKLFIAIYNDQGGQSKRWKTLKRIYNKLPAFLQLPYTMPNQRSCLIFTQKKVLY